MTEKVKMNGVSIELGLGGMPDLKSLNEILYTSTFKGLNIYFDTAVNCTKTRGYFDEIFDEQGLLLAVMVEGETSFLDIGRKCLISTDESNDLNITVLQFTYQDESFYTVDHTGMWLKPMGIDYKDLYCIKSELDQFSGISSKVKKLSRLQQREQVFKTMLTTKATRKIGSDTDYQQCYESIGEPTQDVMWDKLQCFDKQKLFTSGKSDFFKFQKVIQFKEGTGIGR